MSCLTYTRPVRVRADVTTFSVETLIEAWERKTVEPDPEYQRGLTWRRHQQQLLVDSLLREYPLPRISRINRVTQRPRLLEQRTAGLARRCGPPITSTSPNQATIIGSGRVNRWIRA